MIPILYPPGATKDDTGSGNGLGFLTDCFKCEVTEERNGSYEAVFQYPCTGELFSSIADGAIIKAKANETSEPQLFRIYKASAPMNGKVTYYAEHISYALNGLPIIGLHTTDKTAHTTMFQAFSACPIEHEFTPYSDIVTPNSINLDTPTSLRSFLGGDSGSMLDVFGGELEFDNYTVNLWLHRGADNGVVIRYGKNLTDIKQERNISDCYTHLFPYATYKESVTDDDGNITETETTVTIADQVIELINPASVGHKKALIYDFSSEFSDDEEITPETLEAKAQEYIKSADLATPSVNITLSIAALWQSDEYNEQAVEHIKLCDTVHVIFENLGISATAKVIETVYDSLKERYTTITIGSVKSNFATTVKTLTQNIENAEKQIRDQNTVLTTRLLIEDGRILGEITRATEAESLLSTKIQQTAEGLTAEVTRATEAEGTLTSLIDINAEAITAEVQRAEGVENTLSASIKVNADAISAEVTRATTAEGTLSSSIKVNADAISAEVTRATTAEGTLSSSIKVNADAISAEVTRATTAEGTLSSSIKVNADAISAEVTRAKDEEAAITAKIALGIAEDAEGNSYAYLNANADYIAFTANKYITIDSKYFTLSADGAIESTSGKIGGFYISSNMLYYTAKMELNATGGTAYFYDGTYTNINEASGNASYSNIDHYGLGSISRTNSGSTVPYYLLGCTAYSGLDIKYCGITAGTYTSTLKVFIDGDNSYTPTIIADGDLIISADNITLNSILKVTSSQIKPTASIIPTASGFYNLGASNYKWNCVYSNYFKQNGRNVSSPYTTSISSTTKNPASGTKITCGDLLILCLEYTSAVSNDGWVTLDLSEYLTAIYSVNVVGRATSQVSLSSDKYSGCYTVYISGTTAYIGQDSNQSSEGFYVLVLGK